ncbi:hypothetical protein [Aureimonas sp. ME7]|uniref:hypothetical protein n=1 Tax=Aureimonas sp. ME7 TaxID=2744252 RepID=UPI0015F48D1F|nr:hypothetical protein [Aureimonas sp. ME7]
MTDGEALRSLLRYAQNEAQLQNEPEVARHLSVALEALAASAASKALQACLAEGTPARAAGTIH